MQETVKTIVIYTNEINHKPLALYQITEGASAWRYTFNPDTIVFKSKKEAIEKCKLLTRIVDRTYKYIKLNKNQLKIAKVIKNGKTYCYITLDNFLNIK